MKKTKAVIWGLVLIVAGVLWSLTSLDIIEFSFDGWWTLFIIIPSAISLFTSKDKSDGLSGLIIGVLLLLCARGILEYKMLFKLILPVLAIYIGIKLILNAFTDRKIEKTVEKMKENREELENTYVLFSAEKVDCSGKVFRGAELNAIFGGITYDLRNALVEPDAVIKASAIFGCIDILVPENVKVRVKSTSVFGGIDNKAKRPDDGATAVVTLYVSGLCLFGGVDIK